MGKQLKINLETVVKEMIRLQSSNKKLMYDYKKKDANDINREIARLDAYFLKYKKESVIPPTAKDSWMDTVFRVTALTPSKNATRSDLLEATVTGWKQTKKATLYIQPVIHDTHLKYYCENSNNVATEAARWKKYYDRKDHFNIWTEVVKYYQEAMLKEFKEPNKPHTEWFEPG